MPSRILLGLGLVLVGSGCALLGHDLYMRVKAELADLLIARAFAAHLSDGRPHAPWEWADMHPIARLEVPRLGVARHVLSGASGSSMAFGIGHLDGTAAPNALGHTVLVGHRDSWCAFLEQLQCGDEIRLRTPESLGCYRVDEIRIVDETNHAIVNNFFTGRLTLITCYPFAGVLHSHLRYVVTCRRDSL